MQFISQNETIKSLIKDSLITYQGYKRGYFSEKEAIVNLSTHIRPLIETYQSQTNDLNGHNLKLKSGNLRKTYRYACKIIHAKNGYHYFNPKDLKNDIKQIFKYIYSSKTYKKLKKEAKEFSNASPSFTSLNDLTFHGKKISKFKLFDKSANN